jgi:RND family efflux transporter MFP subunit
MKPKAREWIAKGLTALVAIIVVAVAMLWLSGAFRKDAIQPARLTPANPPAQGSPFTVQSVRRLETVDLVGTVQSEWRAVVSSRIQANIVEMAVDTGSSVTKGNLLVTLDDRDLKARLEQAKQMLGVSQVKRDLAKRKVDRLTPLVQQHASSPDELDDWTSQYNTALAEVSNAQQRIREAEVALSDTQIAAPINGIVVERLAQAGDMAMPGKGLLVLYDPDNLRLEAIAREADIGRLEKIRKAGQPIPVLIDSAGKELAGTITQIVPAADPQSRSFVVKVHLPDAAGLYPGMFGRLRLPIGEVPSVEIPRQAVREVGQVSMVNVSASGSVEARAVRLGQRRGDRIEVLAGLAPGEEILLP